MPAMPFKPTDVNNYEVLIGECSSCSAPITFHRIDDLRRDGHALGAEAPCPKCGQLLRIKGDTAHEPFELLLVEVRELLVAKRYMRGIALLAQAVEMFLVKYLRFNFVERPVSNSPQDQELSKSLLHKHIRNMTFEPLRNATVKVVIHGIHPRTSAEARVWIPDLAALGRTRAADHVIAAISAPDLRDLLTRLRDTTIGELRNDVVHSSGYRPNLAEAWRSHEEVSDIVYTLLPKLGMQTPPTMLFWYEE